MYPDRDARRDRSRSTLHVPDAWSSRPRHARRRARAPARAPARTGSRIRAASIDELYDHPIHIGVVAHVQRAGAGPGASSRSGASARRAACSTSSGSSTDLGAIVDDHIARVRRGAVHRLHVHPDARRTRRTAGSSTARRASTSTTRTSPRRAKSYEGLLELLSHELFHAWNGKRIAPQPLLDFDYTREAYTPCLWVMEGITSHYDRFALRSSGPDHREELPREGPRRLRAPAWRRRAARGRASSSRRSTRGSSCTSPTSRTSTRRSATTSRAAS